MDIKILSPLVKVQTTQDLQKEYTLPPLLKGEKTSFQIGVFSETYAYVKVTAKASFPCEIKIFKVDFASMDYPIYDDADDDYITKTPGLMPDILTPVEDAEYYPMRLFNNTGSFFVRLKIPVDAVPGQYNIDLRFDCMQKNAAGFFSQDLTVPVTVLKERIPEESFLYTEWFHVDSIASYYRFDVYSEEHWEYISRYMEAAREIGVTMILVPALTPALDTMITGERPRTQLVDIKKEGTKYSFGFNRFDRYIRLAKEKGFMAFEISHLFSQWGAKCSPNIIVEENGKKELMFGWNNASTAPEYLDFLSQFLPALVGHLKEIGIFEASYFHISDEPHEDALEMYRELRSFVKPLLQGRPIMDALSNLSFVKEGLVDIPVTATSHIAPFLEEHYEDQWAYYCCGQYINVGNHFLAMPSYRNRILGIQLFKYDIKGFLQWGFNFYYAQLSTRLINPYITTSCDRSCPSGDPFIVYPGYDGPLQSIRGYVFADALQDIRILSLAAEKIGREKVEKRIDELAEMEVTFENYPRNDEYILSLMEEMKGYLE